jgi:hypothetical protein|nr:MAG TPA: hypothetical protein [Caudoviricetes sp.]
MLFYDYENALCAYIRNRGFVCVDADSPRFDEDLPTQLGLATCDEATPYTNPYGDVLLAHHRLPHDMCYNTVLQDLVPEDWHNMFTVEDGEPNPYTEMLHGCVAVSLNAGDSFFLGDLTYDRETKTIHCEPDAGEPFDMKKDEFVRTFQVRCLVI